jgi:lysine 2,3-aminomutase
MIEPQPAITSGELSRYDRLPAEAPVSEACLDFRRRCYPNVSSDQWNDWRWQLRNRLRTSEQFSAVLRLSESERSALDQPAGSLPAAVTPYYAHLFSIGDVEQGLRRTHVPNMAERFRSPEEDEDPLNEDAYSPVPGLVHKYPDRVLFLATGSCATYCRYCTRSRMVGDPGGPYSFSISQWRNAIAYIRSHSSVRDVLISGGDPLLLSTEKLSWLLSELRSIPHVELLRIGTKIPLVLPQRITPELAAVLREGQPVWISLHATHPDELTVEAVNAIACLADAGLPLGSQTVLLKGVNDDAGVLTRLVHGLLRCRVRPYYLYQCDPIPGSAEFRTAIRVGPHLISALRGHTTGYAVPTFVVDTPGGKVPVSLADVEGLDNGRLVLKSFDGQRFAFIEKR